MLCYDLKDTTNEVGPQAERQLRCLGASPTKGHDRLMTNLVPTSRTTPLPPACPTCGQPAVADLVVFDGLVANGYYRDLAGHVWATKWVFDPPSQTTA